MEDCVKVIVNKATFLEVGRVFRRAYRSVAANLILTLGNNRLRIEFYGGTCELECNTAERLVAKLTAKAFAGIISAHRHDKDTDGTITLTFRPALGEFATPLAGANAEFLLAAGDGPSGVRSGSP